MRKLTTEDYTVSNWSGGTTTQLAIFPPEAKYADRDFLWRVSSATVELEASDFTVLPDYERLIATLKGDIVLTDNDGAPLRLQPYAVHAFSGADATHSVGRCTDFNLMLCRGRASGTMEAMTVDTTLEPCAPVSLVSTPGETLLLYCADGTCTAIEETTQAGAQSVSLRPGETLLLTEPASLRLSGQGRFLLCRMRCK